MKVSRAVNRMIMGVVIATVIEPSVIVRYACQEIQTEIALSFASTLNIQT